MAHGLTTHVACVSFRLAAFILLNAPLCQKSHYSNDFPKYKGSLIVLNVFDCFELLSLSLCLQGGSCKVINREDAY